LFLDVRGLGAIVGYYLQRTESFRDLKIVLFLKKMFASLLAASDQGGYALLKLTWLTRNEPLPF